MTTLASTSTASDLLLAHLDAIADAPGGVARLRQLILQLAVQGRLAEQDPEDEPVVDTLARVNKSRQIENERANRKRKVFTEDKYPPLPPHIPLGWHRCQLDHCLELINGRAYAQAELLSEGTPVLRIQNLNGSSAWYYSDMELPEEKYCDKGDLLFAWSASFGPYIWWGTKVIYHYHIWKVLPSAALNQQFAYYFLLYLTDQVREYSHGLAMLHMTKAQMEQWPMLLPPLAEQRRIVARVDALMGLCDDLEARQERAGAERRRLLAALVDGLLGARDAGEAAAAWARLSESFDLTLAAPEDVAPLRQAVLQLAVQGRLVEQDPADESANVLLEQIRQEKARLVKEGKLKKAEVSGPIPGDEQPFEVPQRWEWVHLQDVIVFGPSNGISPKAVEVPTNVKSLTLTATTSGKFDGRHFKYIDTEIPRNSDLWLENGDVLVQRGNTIEYVGVPAVYHGLKYEYVYPDLMMKVRPSSQIDVAYLHTAMSSRPLRDYLRSRATGTSGSMPKINHATIVSLPIPLPPLAEQRRIVARVEQLMALCDELEAGLREERAAAERLSAGLCQAVAAQPAAAAILRTQNISAAAVQPAVPPTDRAQPAPALDLDAYAVFAALVVQRHQGTPHSRTLGHVKLEKIAHLGEACAGVDLGRRPRAMPRGPADFDLLTQVIAHGQALDAFDAPAREGSAWGYQFVALPQLDAIAGRFAEVFGARADRLAQIVELLVPLKSRQAEAVATLYAVWNDLRRAGEQPDDAQIFAAFRAFHPEKERFRPEVLERWLGWMRDNGVVPDGSAKPTLPAGHQAAPVAPDAYAAAAALLAERGALTNGDIQAALGVDAAAARALLRRLVSEGLARQEGERRGARYVAIGA